jgi:hypothetical protein
MPLSLEQRVTIASDVLFRIVGDEAVLLNLKTGLYLGLNSVGTRMWSVLLESGSMHEAFERLLGEFEVDTNRLRTDLEEFLRQLLDHGLIEITGERA